MNPVFQLNSESSESVDSTDNFTFMNYNHDNNILQKLYDIINEQNKQIKILEMNQRLILKALKIPQVERPIPVRPKTVCTESSSEDSKYSDLLKK